MAGIHHVEIWIADAGSLAEGGWLLRELDFVREGKWAEGESWAAGGAYVTFTTSPNVSRLPHDRRAPGMDHLAFKAETPRAVDAIMATASAHGWRPLYQSRSQYSSMPLPSGSVR